jgi:hypothetical protein
MIFKYTTEKELNNKARDKMKEQHHNRKKNNRALS